jgi:hypothetical protein
MKRLIISGLCSLALIACKSQPRDSLRRQLIQTFVVALESGDTTQAFNLLDSGYYFQTVKLTKSVVFEDLNEIRRRLSVCNYRLDYNKIEIADGPAHTKSYTLKCCGTTHGTETDNSFDLKFDFADYKDDSKIFDVEIRTSTKRIMPIKAVGPHS